MTRVAINGFGRIGRQVAWAVLARPECGLELVTINDHISPSSTVDSQETAAMDGALVRLASWYDNEWGFSNRMADTAQTMARQG